MSQSVHTLIDQAAVERPYLVGWITQMLSLALTKGHDYAETADPLSNMRSCEAIGVSAAVGVYIRMSDKWSRLTQFFKKSDLDVADETLFDTLIDLCNYACFLHTFVMEARDAS